MPRRSEVPGGPDRQSRQEGAHHRPALQWRRRHRPGTAADPESAQAVSGHAQPRFARSPAARCTPSSARWWCCRTSVRRSDAEMFPDGFRALGLGKIIGVPTMGAVIGTGSFTLLDGSALRTPGAGVYTAKGENMENFGVQPDVYVDNGPADFLAGHDRQIEKAIEVLRSEMK